MASAFARELDRRFKICPFDDNHIIERTRFHSHLIKCKKNHESSNKIMCPYDGSEFISPESMAQHLLVCKKKDLMLMPTESIRDRSTDMDRPLRIIHLTSNEDEKDWNIDDDYVGRDHNEAKQSLNKIDETNRRMQPFYENAYGAVKSVGRGSYLSHLGASPVSRRSSSALSPSIPKTQRKVPGIEEEKDEEYKNEEEEKEGVYDDAEEEEEEEDDDDDDNESLHSESETFWKHYTDIKLPSRQRNGHNGEQNQDKVEVLPGMQQNKTLNSSPINPTEGQEEKKNINSDTKRVFSASDIAMENKIVERRSFGRGFSALFENPSKCEMETKPTTSVEVNENFSFNDIDKQLEEVKFQPSKRRQNGHFTEEEEAEEEETASFLPSQSVFATDGRSPPKKVENVPNKSFKSGLSPAVLRLLSSK